MVESASSSEPHRTVRCLSQQLSDRRRAKTRVNIGEAYARWTQVKDFHGIKTHAERANFLQDLWPDVYLGLTTMGQNMSVPNLQRALSHALASWPSGTTSSSASSCNQPVITGELMVHPGYPSHPQVGGCGEGPDDFSQSADRQHELSMLRDPSLLALYSQKSVQLCAFKDL